MVEVGARIQDTGLDTPNVHRVEPEDRHAVGLACRREMPPQRLGIVARLGVILPAQFVGVAGPGDDDLLSAETDARDTEITEGLRHAVVGGIGEYPHRVRTLDLGNEDPGIADAHVHAGRMRARPAVEIAVGLRVPEKVVGEAQQNAVDE